MKTARDIRFGLSLSRERKVPCRTIKIEDEIKKQIAEPGGMLLSREEQTEIICKEEKRIRIHNQALTKARRKILKRKEATEIIQEVRRGDNPKKTGDLITAPKKKNPVERKGFHAIDVPY